LSCALVPLMFVIGILTILMSYFDFRGILTYIQGNKEVIVVAISSIFRGGGTSTVPDN
jgi:hypothetical protein